MMLSIGDVLGAFHCFAFRAGLTLCKNLTFAVSVFHVMLLFLSSTLQQNSHHRSRLVKKRSGARQLRVHGFKHRNSGNLFI